MDPRNTIPPTIRRKGTSDPRNTIRPTIREKGTSDPLQEGNEHGEINPTHISTNDMVADAFTKYLVLRVWKRHMHSMCATSLAMLLTCKTALRAVGGVGTHDDRRVTQHATCNEINGA